ncbi:TRIP4 protein, partial [Acromyrmex insinuator]
MEKWMQEKLSELLDFPVSDDLTQFILQIENERDLDEYFSTLLNNENSTHRQFVTELKKRRASYNNQTGYKKINDGDNVPKKQNDKKKGKAKGKKNNQVQEAVKPEPKSEKVEKKKTKFVNLLSHGNILLKGRHKCDCEANRHALINNCLNCGRIGDNLYNKLMDQKPYKNLEDSLKQRDKLLEFDRNRYIFFIFLKIFYILIVIKIIYSARRTKVIDDESDYYQSNSIWLSHDERKKLQKQEEEELARKHASRLDRKIAIDFMGRVIVDEDQSINLQSEELDETISYDDFENTNICPTIEFDRPTFIEMGIFRTSTRIKNHTWNREGRIQDKEYLEMFDQGLCLSMHQPYASLLVAGIKTHEGRNWYSSHRGRLWIASAAKVPSAEDISNIKQSYRVLKNDKIEFPENYPTSCLLGCVTITDVLSQQEYRKLYPEGESESPYVFICENSYMLPIQFPMKGKHKIYKMDKKLHQAASKCLEKAMKTGNN